VAGDTIAVTAWLEDVKVREGRGGRMTLVAVASEGVNQEGERAFLARAVLIVTGGAA